MAIDVGLAQKIGSPDDTADGLASGAEQYRPARTITALLGMYAAGRRSDI
jgi:hypothetical protein